MRILKIALNGFRNYEWETAEFDPGTNVITGPNAQGKTNLLEAVYLLSAGRSFRTRFDREMIGFGFSAAEILADVYSHDRQQTIRIVMQPGVTKKIQVNGVRKTAGELGSVLNTVLFCPDDLNLIKEGAAVRRRLLDNAISQIRPRYAEVLAEFNRLYEHKSRILKDWREKPSLLDTLDEFSDAMARASAHLIRHRAAYAARLAAAAAPIHLEFSGEGEALSLRYQTVSTVRDPLEISINGRPARSFASQGQTRTAALSLKLAEREIVLNETGEYPILLLDDVLSELDTRRQEFVLNRIGGGQTLITCCEDEGISKRTGGKVLLVNQGKIKNNRDS